MLYHLLYPLHLDYSFFNVFRYITFRTIYAAITALLLCFVIGPTLLWANLTNPYIWIAVFVTVGYGTIGFIDDYKKVIRKDPKGMSARTKFLCQVVLATVAALLISMD